MLKFKHDTLLFYYGGFIVEDKRHYKLYKHGKLWCCTAITIASLTIGTVVLHANVQADSNQPATTQVVSSSSTEVMANQPATATTENEVPLDQTTRALTTTRSLLMKITKMYFKPAAGMLAGKVIMNATVMLFFTITPPEMKLHGKELPH